MFKQLLAIALVGAGIAPVIAPPVAVVVINAMRSHPATGTSSGTLASGNGANGAADGAAAASGSSNPSISTASTPALTPKASAAQAGSAPSRTRAGTATRPPAANTAGTSTHGQTKTSSGAVPAAATTQIRFLQTISGVVRAVDPVAGSVTVKVRSGGGTTVRVLHEVQGTVITRGGQEIQLIDVAPGSRVVAGVLPTGDGTVNLMQLAVISAG